MTTRRQFIYLLAGLTAAMAKSSPVAAQEETDASPAIPTPPGYIETHRLRIVNRQDGAIQVSTDAGKTWRLLGRVLVPATTVVQGYIAAEYADPGTVAAIAVHGLRIRVSSEDLSLHAPLVLSVDPKEYANKAPNKGYGGHRPGSAGIYTDIPAGASLFRELAPHVGNPVYREDTATGRLKPLSNYFKPDGAGEIILIPVFVPQDALTEVIFNNKAGGAVTATFASGTTQTLTQVVKPVEGVGRFDGTAYTGVGRLNTAHTGVITVCTAPVDGALPEGVGKERRGGFQISPVWHNSRCEEAGAPMVMTVGTPGPKRVKEWEGKAPLFRDAMSLGFGANPKEAGIADMSVDGGPWEPLPTITGSRLYAFTGAGLTQIWKEQGITRNSKDGATAFRIRLPIPSLQRAQVVADAAVAAYATERLAAAKRGEIPLVTGSLTINANPTNKRNVAWVRFSVEGHSKGFTNIAPFTLSWDTTRVPDGEYLIEAEALDGYGSIVATTKQRVFVGNSVGRPVATGTVHPPAGS